MSEIEALLALYGAIDRAAVNGEADVERLGTLLAPYRSERGEPTAIGWYDRQFRPWVKAAKERAVLRARAENERETSEQPPVDMRDEPPAMQATDAGEFAEAEPSPPADADAPLSLHAEEIRAALAAFGPMPIEGRGAARRLLAVTAAAHALPRVFGSDGSQAATARAALAFDDTGGNADVSLVERRAGQLHDRLAEQFHEMRDWSPMVRRAVDDGLLPESLRSQESAPPCTGRLIMRPDPITGDLEPCTVLEAEFTTDEVKFADVKRYLEPANWQFPGSLWCRMERYQSLPPDSWLYHETVSTDCSSNTPLWSVSTDLRFWFSHPTANEARVEYDLAPGLPTPFSDIEIDEGSLRVIELPNGDVRVVTTKRVRFAGAFDGAGLAMFMCAIGYSTMLEDMVFSVAYKPAGNIQPFPVTAPQGGTMSPSQSDQGAKGTSNAKANPNTKSGDAESLDDIAAKAADFFASYFKDYAKICTSSMDSMQKGTYKVENAWSDGIKLWSMYVDGMSKALDFGSRTAKAAAPDPPKAGDTPTPGKT